MEDDTDPEAEGEAPSAALVGYLWYAKVDGVPVPLGFHTRRAPSVPGLQEMSIPGTAGQAAYRIGKGMEALGDLMVSVPPWFYAEDVEDWQHAFGVG